MAGRLARRKARGKAPSHVDAIYAYSWGEIHVHITPSSKLLEAIDLGDSTEISRLLAAGASVNTACKRPHAKWQHLIPSLSSSDVRFTGAPCVGDVEEDEEDESHFAPLARAARAGRLRAVQMLLSAGANVNFALPFGTFLQQGHGETALHAACEGRSAQIVSLLILMGADVASCAYNGFQPLHYACHALGDTDVMRLLIDADASVNIATTNGYEDETPLTIGALSADRTPHLAHPVPPAAAELKVPRSIRGARSVRERAQGGGGPPPAAGRRRELWRGLERKWTSRAGGEGRG